MMPPTLNFFQQWNNLLLLLYGNYLFRGNKICYKTQQQQGDKAELIFITYLVILGHKQQSMDHLMLQIIHVTKK